MSTATMICTKRERDPEAQRGMKNQNWKVKRFKGTNLAITHKYPYALTSPNIVHKAIYNLGTCA